MDTVLYWSRFSREPIGLYTYVHTHIHTIMKRVIIRSWLMLYGGWQVPRSAVGKLEPEESEWYSSNPSPKAWGPKRPAVGSSLNTKAGEDWCSSSKTVKQREWILFYVSSCCSETLFYALYYVFYTSVTLVPSTKPLVHRFDQINLWCC